MAYIQYNSRSISDHSSSDADQTWPCGPSVQSRSPSSIVAWLSRTVSSNSPAVCEVTATTCRLPRTTWRLPCTAYSFHRRCVTLHSFVHCNLLQLSTNSTWYTRRCHMIHAPVPHCQHPSHVLFLRTNKCMYRELSIGHYNVIHWRVHLSPHTD